MKVILRAKFFLSFLPRIQLLRSRSPSAAANLSIIAGATLMRSPLTRDAQRSRLRASRRIRHVGLYGTSYQLVNGSSQSVPQSPYQHLVGDGDDLPAMGHRYSLNAREGGRIDLSVLRVRFPERCVRRADDRPIVLPG